MSKTRAPSFSASAPKPAVESNEGSAPSFPRVVAIAPSQLAELGQEVQPAQAPGETADNLVYVELSALLTAMNQRLEEIAHALAEIAQSQQGAAPADREDEWEPERLPFDEFAALERRHGESEQELEARWYYHAEYIPLPAGRRETQREKLNRIARMSQRYKGYCKRRGQPPSRGGLKRRRKDD